MDCWKILCLLGPLVAAWNNEKAPHVNPIYGTKGMMIDAGSGGSRLHIFTWHPRVFSTVPPPLTIPTDNEKYTDRISPGMSDFVDDFNGLEKYFAVLIESAKATLIDDREYWPEYPFYLRATGGMRSVPYRKREDMMAFTRQLFSNKTFCPFMFQFDFARVMAGEEEAVYSWTTANYLFGTLLHNTLLPGIGPVISPINRTYGIVDLGGASAQISFFVPSQDISEGLFKLQIGSQRHWNVYSKSFLSYGHNSARDRHLKSLVMANLDSESDSDSKTITSECFFSGYKEDYQFTLQKKHSTIEKTYQIIGPSHSSKHQFENCYELLYPLLRKELNVFCNEVYDNECSMDGFYQPSLPIGDNGHFVASATYKYAWYFLQLPEFGTISSFKDRAKVICGMDYKEIKSYYKRLNSTIKKDELLPYYCFLTSYVAVLLEKGFGFNENQTIHAVDTVNGHKTGWALGSMIYLINGLPFTLQQEKTFYLDIGSGALAGFISGALVIWFYYTFLKHAHHGYMTILDNNPNLV